ncbi:hypothetical protein EST38_g3568 [Candolleomyces aberdarensis]|uniref:Uncharacterized protein n=1 Tax=Candolleomyces aberdarensis TaxID=2316362 RepID=A0A4Q2DTQ7_9AGAR|nr:hypothetical protein EST38_g3568 [Candolleomyces aberdarensis]
MQPKRLSPTRVKWWLAVCVAFTILAPVISIIMGWTLHAKEMAYPGPGDIPLFQGRTINFEVVLISADPKAGSMKVDWRILGEKNSQCRADNLGACTEVNIFFDTADGTHSTQEEILSSDRPTRPLFRFNATALAVNDLASRVPTFRTQLALFSPDSDKASLLFYPFDSYLAEIIFFAQEEATNATVGVEIARTRGIAVGLETHFGHRDSISVPPGLVEATITLTRSRLVKLYCIVATIAVWLITLILVLVMITTVFFGFKQRGEVLLVPVATLFAFTQLRQSMPGAPEGFGDIIGMRYLPNHSLNELRMTMFLMFQISWE